MLGWFGRHNKSISALSALLTAALALAALIGIKVQIDSAAKIQREQSARDIYREYLNLSVQKPEFAAPDYCSLSKSPQYAAYEAYVDYLLYTGEQVISVDVQWEKSISRALKSHAAYLCEDSDDSEFSDALADLLKTIRTEHCKAVAPC